MRDLAARELRNDVSAVLRRVEAGETFRVTVSGRAVAQLSPLPRRPRYRPWAEFWRDQARWQADPGLRNELARMVPDTTDDAPSPELRR